MVAWTAMGRRVQFLHSVRMVDTLDRHWRTLQQALREGSDRAAIVGALRRFQTRVGGLKLGLGVI
eukprot:COSAG01_NODE_7934_length_2985_cov_8.088011_3_plen_65_part_00